MVCPLLFDVAEGATTSSIGVIRLPQLLNAAVGRRACQSRTSGSAHIVSVHQVNNFNVLDRNASRCGNSGTGLTTGQDQVQSIGTSTTIDGVAQAQSGVGCIVSRNSGVAENSTNSVITSSTNNILARSSSEPPSLSKSIVAYYQSHTDIFRVVLDFSHRLPTWSAVELAPHSLAS